MGIATSRLRWQFIALCLLNIFMALFEISVAGSISLLGIAMASPASLDRISLLSRLQQMLPVPDHIHPALLALMCVMSLVAIVTICKNLLLARLTWQQNAFAQAMAWQTGIRLFEKLLHAPHIWHIQQNSSELLTFLAWKTHVANYLVHVLTLITQLFITVCLLVSAFFLSPLMSLFLFSIILLMACAIYKFTRAKAYTCGLRLQQYDLHNARVSMQGIHGIKEILIGDNQKEFVEAYQLNTKSYIRTACNQAIFNPLPVFVLESLGMALLLAVLIMLSFKGASLAEVSGTLTLLAGISWRLLPSANKSVGSLLGLKSLQPTVEQILAKLESTPSAHSSPQRTLLPFKEYLELRDITFFYPDTRHSALTGVTLRIPRRKMIGLVGLSGSGKSTLTNIITGLLQPSAGQVVVDGTPWDATQQRLALGYVPQHLYLLDASLADNVAFHIQGGEIDEARVRSCCNMAAMDFVSELPGGFQTILGERGVRLSGGQIQRVGIARALYSQPAILIFDEATSALDGATEQAIQNTIESLRESITMLVIAHRLTTVQNCDYIYWMDNGMIRKEGTPDEVLSSYSAFLSEHALEVIGDKCDA